MSYEAQLKYKPLVRDAVERIGGLKGAVVHDAIGMKDRGATGTRHNSRRNGQGCSDRVLCKQEP